MSREAIDAERRARLTLERRLGELESRVRGMWVFPATVTGSQYKQLRVGAGNTLATIDSVTYYGLKRASTLTAVPTLAPASISTTYSDGLSAAYDLGGNPIARTSGTLVWITAAGGITTQNPDGGSDIISSNLYRFQIPENRLFFALDYFMVPVSGSPGTYAKVYVPAVVSA